MSYLERLASVQRRADDIWSAVGTEPETFSEIIASAHRSLDSDLEDAYANYEAARSLAWRWADQNKLIALAESKNPDASDERIENDVVPRLLERYPDLPLAYFGSACLDYALASDEFTPRDRIERESRIVELSLFLEPAHLQFAESIAERSGVPEALLPYR